MFEVSIAKLNNLLDEFISLVLQRKNDKCVYQLCLGPLSGRVRRISTPSAIEPSQLLPFYPAWG